MRIRFGRIELTQHDLAMGPGQLKHPIGETPVLILVDQTQAQVAGLSDARHQIHRDRLFRFEDDRTTDGHNGVQHGALTS